MRAALHVIAKIVVLVTTFVVALAVGVVANMNAAPVRRAATARTNQALASLLRGHIVVERVDRLQVWSVDADVIVLGEDGAPVILAHGVRARVDLLTLVSSLLSQGPIAVSLTHVSVQRVDARVDRSPDGDFAVAQAFASKTPHAPKSEGGRPLRLSIPQLSVEHAWVHGVVPGAPAVDVDLTDLRGGVLVAADTLTLDVDSVSLLARGVPLPTGTTTAQGRLGAHLELPSAHGDVGGRATWHGTVGPLAVTLEGALDGPIVDATIDAPTIAPDALRALWPSSPVSVDGAVHAEVHGALPRLTLTAKASVAGSSLALTGPLTVGPATRADLEIEAAAVDLRVFDPSGPTSKLGAKGAITLERRADGALAARAAIDFMGGVMGARRVPALRLDAKLDRDPAGRTSGEATIASRDPRIQAEVVLRLVPTGAAFEVAYDVEAHTPDIGAVDWLGVDAHGATRVSARGRLDVERGSVETHARIEVDDASRDTVRVHHANVTVDAHGPLRAPTIDASLDGELLDVAYLHLNHVHVETQGPPSHMRTSLEVSGENVPNVDLECVLSLTSGASIRDVSATFERRGEHVRAQVGSVQLAGDRLRVDDAHVEGLGEPARLSLDATRDSLRVQAEAKELHLARVARLLGIEDELRGGNLSLDADLFVKRDAATGHVRLDLRDGAVGSLEGIATHLDAQIEGRSITGAVHFALADAGSVDVTTLGFQIERNAPVLRSLKRAWGRVEIDGRVELAKLETILPKGTLPVDASGDVTLHGGAWRDSPDDDTLGALLDVRTTALRLAGRAPATWKVEGVDLDLNTRLDGETGFTDLDARVRDATGELVALDLKAATLPFGQLTGTRQSALAALRVTPFNARVTFPSRDLATLPPAVSIPGLHGKAVAAVEVTGPLDAVAVDLSATIGRARLDESDVSLPLDVTIDGHYDGAQAKVQLDGKAHKASVLSASAALDLRVADALDAPPGALPWKASAKAHVEGFPLDSVRALSDRQIHGTVGGDLSLDDLHEDAKLTVTLALQQLHVGDVAFPSGAAKLSIDGQSLDAMAKLAQTDGSFRATAHAGAAWGRAIAPALDPKRPLHAELAATGFRAEAFLPFVDSTFTELDGRLDANANVTLDPVARKATLDGSVGLKEGRFELAAIGGEFRDATATLKFTPDGVITLENASANGMTGRIEAAASARVDGAGLVGANASIVVPKSQPLLLSVEGAQVGTVDGSVGIAAKSSADRHELAVTVNIPTLHVQLPDQTTRSVQVLGPMSGVAVGVGGGTRPFVATTLDPVVVQTSKRAENALRVDVTVVLGSDVQASRGNTLSIAVEGKPTIAVTDRTRVSGQLVLRGSIDVQGKKFDIDDGRVTFVGDDPSNPQVVLTASWTADDDEQTRVYASFVGPLKTGAVHLTSEPAHGPTEILSLLLFGSLDGMPTNAQGSGASTAAGAAGGAATQPLNRALQQFGLGGVQTRVDTSTANARPEVEFEIARNISFQVAWVIIPTLENPDTTLLTLDWRFLRAWSLATTVGNAGSSIMDLLWHYRY